ncbi:hypothetical protein TNCV_4321141 [Trichonephila clavipes]|uniref:Uncharacterized protein n=1 Tax=Trichonephila clavipes TaxID=2585209 RepID=A0A8X6SDV3_TRICX|nr:hypothetical protein TNCV_4321141 [Trichonephila clavipes]
MRRFSLPKEKSSREARGESDRTRETRTKDSGGHSAALRAERKQQVADPDHCIESSETSVKQESMLQCLSS